MFYEPLSVLVCWWRPEALLSNLSLLYCLLVLPALAFRWCLLRFVISKQIPVLPSVRVSEDKQIGHYLKTPFYLGPNSGSSAIQPCCRRAWWHTASCRTASLQAEHSTPWFLLEIQFKKDLSCLGVVKLLLNMVSPAHAVFSNPSYALCIWLPPLVLWQSQFAEGQESSPPESHLTKRQTPLLLIVSW